MNRLAYLLPFIFAISILLGCNPDNTYNKQSLAKYQEMYKVKEVEKVPEDLWVALSQDYVVGQSAIPDLIKGKQVWKPKRYFGNFQEGSELEQLQIVLSGMDGSFYYNDFFESMSAEDQDIFKIYYRPDYRTDNLIGVTVPDQQTPQKVYRDHKPILQVDSIDYSQKYGGSVVMKFELTDFYDEEKEIVRLFDYGYEFSHDIYTFDIKDIIIEVYIVPKLSYYNPIAHINIAIPSNEMHVEIYPKNVIAYKNNVLIRNFDSSPDYAIFNDYIRNWEQSLTTSFRSYDKKKSLFIFAHAFTHYMHSTLLSPLTEKVTDLFVTDGFFDLTSEIYEGLAAVSWKIQGIDFYGWESDLELKVSYKVNYLRDGGYKKEITRGNLELGTYEDSYYLPIGIFNESDLDLISGIEIVVKIKEDDPISDDEYETIRILFDVDDDIVKPKVISAVGGPVDNGLTIYDHEFLDEADQVDDKPGFYLLEHDLYDKDNEERGMFDEDGYLDSYLYIAIIKR